MFCSACVVLTWKCTPCHISCLNASITTTYTIDVQNCILCIQRGYINRCTKLHTFFTKRIDQCDFQDIDQKPQVRQLCGQMPSIWVMRGGVRIFLVVYYYDAETKINPLNANQIFNFCIACIIKLSHSAYPRDTLYVKKAGGYRIESLCFV